MTLRILAIEDEVSILSIIEEILSEDYDILTAENGFIGLQLAFEHKPDLILCDVMMPGMDGYEVLTKLRENPQTKLTPFIFLTAKSEKGDIRSGMNLGADDYLTKPFTMEELIDTVNARLNQKKTVQDHYSAQYASQEKELNHLLYYDRLTNLPNQLCLQEWFTSITANLPELKEDVSHANNDDTPKITLIHLNLDKFKRINQDLSEQVGDEILKAVARRLLEAMPKDSMIARAKADDFLILIPPMTDKQEIFQVVQQAFTQFQRAFRGSDRHPEIFITATIGAAVYPQHGRTLDELLHNAKDALSYAKKLGGNQFKFYSLAFSTKTSSTINLESDLRRAIANHHLEVYYQPFVSLKTGAITGAEALLRWHHPQKGMVSPGVFIPIAEETGLIEEIGEWVLSTACQQMKKWQTEGWQNLTMSVNISPRQFDKVDWRQRLTHVILDTGMNPDCLKLELTESVLVKNPDNTLRNLKAIKALGVEIAIDDFGTGYSSLKYLQRFPFDVLKIDQSFVRNIDVNTTTQTINKSIIAMAHALHLQVIAEGVETLAELQHLKLYDCDMIQGFVFSPALTAREFTTLLIEKKNLFAN